MPRLLVTGGAGFIGANFVHYWLSRYPEDRVVVLDALTYAGNLGSLEAVRDRDGLRFVHGDIRDERIVGQLLTEEKLDTIVHFAAESHVDRSILEPHAFLEVNVLGTHSLLKTARRVWLQGSAQTHRFHHVSTDEVYGSLGAEDPPFTETTPYAPNSPYAASKASSDHLVRAYWKTYGLESTISNCSNNYGPYQHPEKLIPLSITHLLEGKKIPVYGDGENVRNWLQVDDHCAGIDQVLRAGRPGRIYCMGTDAETTNLELLRQLCGAVDNVFAARTELAARFPRSWAAQGVPSIEAITSVEDRPGHDRRYAIDSSRARDELGFVPSVQLEDGLRQTVAWYLDNEPWWRGVLDGSSR